MLKQGLTLREASKIEADDTFIFLLLAAEEIMAWCFMCNLCLAENLQEISSLVFSKKTWKNIQNRLYSLYKAKTLCKLTLKKHVQ